MVNPSKETELTLDNVLVVRDYMLVFTKNLLRLPHDREIVFNIKLVSRTAHISREPYQLAPTELKELKVQLEDMIDKGFIRPSHSP